MVIRTLHVKRYERALVFRRGDLQSLLGPGTYRRAALLDAIRGIHIERVSTLDARFVSPILDVLVKDDRLRPALHVLEIADDERALGWKDGRLTYILGPGRHAFWKEPYDLRFEVFGVSEDARLDARVRDAALGLPDAYRYLEAADVEAEHEALVYEDGKLVARLREGPYVCWKTSRKVRVVPVDLRERTADVSGQEIMTRDKVTLRVNLVVTWKVVDAEKAVRASSDLDRALYREAQLALRTALGARTLDQLLAEKGSVGEEVERALVRRAPDYGVRIVGLGLRDIILPGDMKLILNEVILAQKQSEANLIRRREETAAARSQANTARLLAANPTLARMKELEALQGILAGAKATFVLGGGDLALQLRSLVGRPDEGDAED